MKDFKLLDAEVLKGMNAEELQSYYVAKLAHEKVELDARIKSLEDAKDTEDYKELAKEVKALKANELETFKSALEEQGRVIKGLKDGSIQGATVNHIDGSIEKALKENAENFKSHANNGKEEFSFNIKAVGDMTFAANLSGGNMPQAQRLEGINDIAERVAVAYGMMPKLNTSANVIDCVYETAQEGAAA